MKKFAAKTARPIPVIILADTSGSMSVNGKIDALNFALKDLIGTFQEESRLNAEIHLSVITFGGSAQEHLPMIPAHKIEGMEPLIATGGTPMGGALELAQQIIEDKEKVPSRAYRPVIVMVSDGHPTDGYHQSFTNFCNSERASKATRMAMAIGSDADESLMSDFVNDLEAPLFKAKDARDIIKFFRAVSMSITSRSRSATPNQSAVLEFDDSVNELDLEF
ncbi:vWA domain-containing protein [Pelagibaculum spongiae]|uniref:Tellurite resistance protein TerY n=1 Tax=Pelagibaculum spongiae TaxID=2080658 RepID=A0A2V1GPE5_9GAMM|nr:VWA domain-containing protein [Pelagibaculum spongiae]PVZ64507.1 tellurite resistance protein TerY [Pelagibaculum spongiae]